MTRATPQPLPAFVEVALPLPLRQGFTYRLPDEMADEAQIGRVVEVPFGPRRLFGIIVDRSSSTDLKKVRPVQRILPATYTVCAEDLALGRWLAGYYGCSEGEALDLFLPPRPGTRARRSPLGEVEEGTQSQSPPEPNVEQSACIEAVGPAVREGRSESFLLHGVTGSGKTEVYLRLIEEAMDRGRCALVLLPEIALTPQTLRRLRERFPGQVAPYHSRLSHGERCAVWEAAAAGKLPVVVGPRSAAFVPRPDLGLIVVDEEHDSSYKADDRPRYHARDVALMRGSLHRAPVLLGSATPSLESWHNADEGKHRWLHLPQRINRGAGLPPVELVDRRQEDWRDHGPLTNVLAGAIEGVLERDEQVIILHNRRGFARWLQCHACGEVIECPHCDISLTYHLDRERLQCHYCGYERALPAACPECEDPGLRQHGTGTQRVEVTLETRFPQARILRLDQDSTSRKHAHEEILETFRRGEADILVGTQMVAKGLHFPRVSLVGIIDADVGLHFPDFRAHERSFQLLTQVSGRSGRTGPGRVIVQTFDPEHRVLLSAIDHDVKGFLRSELAQRRPLAYPPFGRLATVSVTATTPASLDAALDWLDAGLRSALRETPVQLLGPARAALPRINRRYRGQILLKGRLSTAAKSHILDLFDELRSRPRARRLELALDVDPQHLL